MASTGTWEERGGAGGGEGGRCKGRRRKSVLGECPEDLGAPTPVYQEQAEKGDRGDKEEEDHHQRGGSSSTNANLLQLIHQHTGGSKLFFWYS